MTKPELKSPASYFDQDMTEPEFVEALGGQVGIFSARCPTKTSANEDSAAIVPFDETSFVLIVADGMGGHAAGEIASRTAVEELTAAIVEARKSDSLLRSGIITGFERANEAIKALGTGGGTTLAVVEISDGYARCYHAGDSIILIVSSHGKIKLETTSHSPVGFGVEAGLLDEDEAAGHEHRHLILNAIGHEGMRIEIGSPVKLAKRDTVLLASDGLSDNMPIQDIADGIRKGHLPSTLTRLVNQCRDNMLGESENAKPDDLAIVVFRPRSNHG